MVNPKQYYTLQEIREADYAINCQSRQQLEVFINNLQPVTRTTGLVMGATYWQLVSSALMAQALIEVKKVVDFDKISWEKEQVEANKLAVLCHDWEEAKYVYEFLTGELLPEEAKESYINTLSELGLGLTPIVIGYDEQKELNFDHPQREGFALMHHCWITPEQLGYRKLADILVEIVNGELIIKVKGEVS